MPPSKEAPKLQKQLELQKQPKKRWKVVQQLGTQGGGLNEGINKVEAENDPYDRFFIEKVFTREHIQHGWAEKEIVLLHQVCDHDNVVEYVDHYLDIPGLKSSLYMEYCESGSLENVITAVRKGSAVHERKIWRWFISVMGALVYCHYGPNPDDERSSRLYWDSVYHRDIKPGNILLKKNNEKGEIIAKLGDFGCATSDHLRIVSKQQQDASRASAMSRGFDAPEHPEFSRLTDVWQLALCMACVCAGIMNPRSKNNTDGQPWDRRQPAGRRYSRALNEALTFCLVEERIRRPRSKDALKHITGKYEQIKDTLPLDDKPMDAFWKSNPKVAQTPQPVRPPQPVAEPDKFPYHWRPGLPDHAYTDPELQRMGQRGSGYLDHLQGQRSPIVPQNMNEMMYGGPGGFDPRFNGWMYPSGMSLDGVRFPFGPGRYPGPGGRRRRM